MDKKLSIQEFVKLPETEKARRYKDMSEHDKFLWRTQYDNSFGEVTGYVERTKEEQEASAKVLHQILIDRGIIKD